MKNIYKINLVVMMLVAALFSCSEEEVGSPTIQTFSSQMDPNASGTPGTLLKIEGSNLSGLEQIVLDNKLNIAFNPNLNSDVAIFFNIPNFDFENPYNFGIQPIKFVTANGVLDSQINIIQPTPVIDGFSVLNPKLGDKVTIKGSWFIDVVSVTFGDEPLDYTLVSDEEMYFSVPTDAEEGAHVVITTSVGSTAIVEPGPGVSNTTFVDINFGFVNYLFEDFDGNGLYTSTWGSYGDAGALSVTAAGQTGNCAQYDYNGGTAFGYNGCQNNEAAAFLPSTATAASKVTFKMMVNVSAGTSFDVYLDTWAYNFTIATTGWQEVSAVLDQFGSNYNPGNAATDTDKVDPSGVLQVKVSLPNNGNANNVQFDDIEFRVEE
ncbi:IPT/TIG domain-containing protein [uncultured Algibacter sp.]|uniref:IPT/TIG domain-containing protein n=1 Tax=uncultured Algibacter sp. TaxID=298659 RepID=UPI0026071BAD|nr:IPT/TIG domain-containing protein [uncultured Algibacter sp.]